MLSFRMHACSPKCMHVKDASMLFGPGGPFDSDSEGLSFLYIFKNGPPGACGHRSELECIQTVRVCYLMNSL